MTSRPKDQLDHDNENALALESFLPYRLARAAEMVSRQFAENYRHRYGLSRPEWRTLATIGQYKEVTATEICVHSSMHKTKVSRAIRALEQRNWINREADTQDRRIEHISLTREGSRHYRDLVRLARDYEAQLLKTLGSAGAEKLMDGLSAVETRLFDR